VSADGFFPDAVDWTFGHEGGFANARGDRGGPTNMGITLETLKRALGSAADLNHDGRIDAEDVKLLSHETALGIYRKFYWLEPHLDLLGDRDIAMKVFDLGVHAGPHAAVTLLQRAIDHAKPGYVAPIPDDGALGPRTLATLAQCDGGLVLAALCSEQALFYLRIIEHDPEQAQFKTNWLARARELPPAAGVAARKEVA